jgi:hypothetical protein
MWLLITFNGRMVQNNILLDFKVSPCCSNDKVSSWNFPDVWVLKSDVSEHCVGSIFNTSLFITCWRWNSVPKRRLLILRRRGNTQKTIYHNILVLQAVGVVTTESALSFRSTFQTCSYWAVQADVTLPWIGVCSKWHSYTDRQTDRQTDRLTFRHTHTHTQTHKDTWPSAHVRSGISDISISIQQKHN